MNGPARIPARIIVELYRPPTPILRIGRRPQLWRWRAKNAGNHKVLAVSSEAYVNRVDARDAILSLFGAQVVVLREPGRADVLVAMAAS